MTTMTVVKPKPAAVKIQRRIDVQVLGDWANAGSQWDQFVLKHPKATSDHLWAWRSILSKSFGFKPYYLAALQDSQIVGVLPLFQVPRLLGRNALCSIPYGNYGGILANDGEISAALLKSAKLLMHDLKSESLELRHREPLLNGSLKMKSVHTRFFFPIEGDEAALFKRLGRGNRNVIRKASKVGLRTVVTRDVDQLYEIHVETFRRLGTPCFPKQYFQSILEEFGRNAQIHLVYKHEEVVGYDLVLFFRDQVIFQFSGSRQQFFKDKPNPFMFWEKVKLCLSRGAKELDYCRSRNGSGNAVYKKGLRMQAEPLAYQYYLKDPLKEVSSVSPSNPKYQMMIKTWQRLPLGWTRVLGPQMVRYFA